MVNQNNVQIVQNKVIQLNKSIMFRNVFKINLVDKFIIYISMINMLKLQI